MKTFLSRFATNAALGLALIVGAALLCGFFGRNVPFFDSLAHFRAHLAAVLFALALVLLVSRNVAAAILSAAVAAGAAVSVAGFMVPRPADPEPALSRASAPAGGGRALKLLQMNLRFNAATAPAIEMIERLRPDVVTLEEMNRRWVDAIAPLRERFPYTAFCGVGEVVGGVAILSRIPFLPEDAVCRAEDGFVARRLDLGDGSGLTVVAEHLVWPWPYHQGRQVDRLGQTLSQLGKPLVIAGDFNAAPWSGTVRHYAERSGTQPVAGIGATWLTTDLPAALRPLVGLPIDNVLVSSDVAVLSAARQPATESDHLPILVRFDLPTLATPPRLVGRATGD
ncbi:endonuclease/exonuclease/phosphatase family protein [Aurantimonas sp. 22II-16-19i]|uniref:endonuclease/exonuclease/phosphatase family protein n=1 Tax=Aurantimonas sp. 22II-16-19i TaxID=1317114 RepID=UPI0009F7D5F7|nr:endonuclease/exonuclease/phosphatase family protein [Aurantimonas sp. 22II-16-19i]ORE93927.1 endonuclease/exonuclease/phosphatase [Aurantimonas sp. 22II-16-19i]